MGIIFCSDFHILDITHNSENKNQDAVSSVFASYRISGFLTACTLIKWDRLPSLHVKSTNSVQENNIASINLLFIHIF